MFDMNVCNILARLLQDFCFAKAETELRDGTHRNTGVLCS